LPANNPDADERERGRENEIPRKRWREEDEMRAVEKRRKREIKKKGRNKEEKIKMNYLFI
jgi:hypothetical protein